MDPAVANLVGAINYWLAQLNVYLQNPVAYILLTSVGVAAYVFIVWTFYRHMSKRDLVTIDLSKYAQPQKWQKLKILGEIVLYVISYFIVFPVYAFAFYLLVTASLLVLASSAAINTILVFGLVILIAVRILAYVKAEAAQEIAKLLPLVLLSVVLIDPAKLNGGYFWQNLDSVWAAAVDVSRLFWVVIGAEWTLRLLYLLKISVESTFGPPKKQKIVMEVDQDELEELGEGERQTERARKK